MSLQYTLPRKYFTSTAVFQDEIERIFHERWICVGRAEKIAKPGDYFIQTVGDENIIIVRDNDGQARAFYNTCRHRGTLLCENETGHFCKTIQCPYHAWTYALDGRLIGVPDEHEMGFDKADFPLHQAAVAGLDLRGQTVLDIGCALGGCDLVLAGKFGAQVIGLDIEPALIEGGESEWPKPA